MRRNGKPLSWQTKCIYKHPEVAQLVKELFGRTDHATKSTSVYKYPEVEQVVTNLLNKDTPAEVDLTDDPKDHGDTPASCTAAEKPVTHDQASKSTIDCENENVLSGKTPEISPVPPDSPELSNINCNVETNENEIPDRHTLEKGELVTADDCSTSNTTEELLEEMGLLPTAGKGSKSVKPATNIMNDVSSGSDKMNNAIVPEAEHKEIPPKCTPIANTEQHEQLPLPEPETEKKQASSDNETVTVKQDTEAGDNISGSESTIHTT